MFKFCDIAEIQQKTEVLLKKISVGEEISENINVTRSEAEFAPIHGHLTIYRTTLNKTTIAPVILNIIKRGTSKMKQGRTPGWIVGEVQVFFYLLP